MQVIIGTRERMQPVRKIFLGASVVLLLAAIVCWFTWPRRSSELFRAATKIQTMVLSPNGSVLAVAEQRKITLIDTGTGMAVDAITAQGTDPIAWMRWDPSGRYVLWSQSNEPGRTTVYNIDTHEVVLTTAGRLAPGPTLWSPANVVLVRALNGVYQVDHGTWTMGSRVAPASCGVMAINVPRDRVVCQNGRKNITVSSLTAGQQRLQVPSSSINPSASPDTNWALTGRPRQDGPSVVELVDLVRGEAKTIAEGTFITSQWSTNDQVAVATLYPDRVFVYEVSSGRKVDTGIETSVEEPPSFLHWHGQVLWIVGRNTTVTSLFTHTVYVLYKYNMQNGRVTTMKLADEPYFVAWDDLAGQVYMVLGDDRHVVTRFSLK